MTDKQTSGRGRKSSMAGAGEPATPTSTGEPVTGPLSDGNYVLSLNGKYLGNLRATKNKNTIVSLIDGVILTKSDKPFKFVQTLAQRDAATDVSKHKTKLCRHFPDCELGDECTFIHPSPEEGIPCVAIVIFNEKGFYLVGVEPKGKPRAGAWGIPTGKVKPGEGSVVAAVRELEEETALVIKAEDLIFESKQEYTDDKGIVYKTNIYSGLKSKCTPGKAIAKDKLERMMYIEKSSDLANFFDDVELTHSITFGDNTEFGAFNKMAAALAASTESSARPSSPDPRFQSALPATAKWCNEVEKKSAPATDICAPAAPAAESESPRTPEIGVHPARDEDAGSRASADSAPAGSKTAATGPFRMLIDNVDAMPNLSAGCDELATTLRVTHVEEGDSATGKATKTHTKRFFFLKWDSPKKQQIILICGKSKVTKTIPLNEYTAKMGQVVAETRDVSKPNTTVLTEWEQMMMDYILSALQGF